MLDFWTIEKNYKAVTATTVKAETSTASYVTSPSLFSKETGSSGSTVSNVNSVFGPFLPTEKTQVLTEIPGWSVLKDDNERQKSLNTYLEKFSTKEAQYAEVQRLLSKAKTEDDFNFLAATLSSLKPENQLPVLQTIVPTKKEDSIIITEDKKIPVKVETEEEKKQREHQELWTSLTPSQRSNYLRGGKRLAAKEIANDPKDKQLLSVQMITKSNDDNTAVIIVASQVSKLDKTNQTFAVEIFENANVSDELKKQVDKSIINQYSEFARENQVDIHTIMSDSKFTETVEYAAQNIYKFAKENQIKAVNITIGTDNEKAILAAASQIYKCSQENQEAIKTALVNTSFESVCKEVARQEQIKTDEPTKTKKEEAINDVKEDVKDKETQTQKIALEQKIAKIEEKIQNKEDITEDVGELSNAQKIILLKQCPSAEVVKAMIDLGASTEILAHIKVSTITQINYKKMTGTIINFLSDDVQQYIVTKCSSDGNLDSISRKYLKAGAKKIYDKAIEEKENKEKRGVTLG